MCKSWQDVFQSLPEPFCNFSAFYSCHARKSFGRQYIVSRTPDYRQTLDSKVQTTSQVHQTTMLRSSCLISGGEFELCSWVYDLMWCELECCIYIELCMSVIVQYVSALFANVSLNYLFYVSRTLSCFNPLKFLFFYFYFFMSCLLLCVFCHLYYCSLRIFLFLPFLYKFKDHCQLVETRLQ